VNPLQINAIRAGSEVDLVAEDRRQFGCVSVAADPGHQIGVVHDAALTGVQVEPVRQSGCDDGRSEHVLHRLAEAEIDPERKGGK
jgi:hypothetical protein